MYNFNLSKILQKLTITPLKYKKCILIHIITLQHIESYHFFIILICYFFQIFHYNQFVLVIMQDCILIIFELYDQLSFIIFKLHDKEVIIQSKNNK
jgi:hypothetical protein